MTAAKGILRLTSIIVLLGGGKFRNNLLFTDLKEAKVMCSAPGRGFYFFLQ